MKHLPAASLSSKAGFSSLSLPPFSLSLLKIPVEPLRSQAQQTESSSALSLLSDSSSTIKSIKNNDSVLSRSGKQFRKHVVCSWEKEENFDVLIIVAKANWASTKILLGALFGFHPSRLKSEEKSSSFQNRRESFSIMPTRIELRKHLRGSRKVNSTPSSLMFCCEKEPRKGNKRRERGGENFQFNFCLARNKSGRIGSSPPDGKNWIIRMSTAGERGRGGVNLRHV